MRNLDDAQSFLKSLETIVQGVEESDYGEIFTRKLVADISKWSSRGFDFELRIDGKLKLREKLVLAIYSWYTSSDVLRVYLRLYLEEEGLLGLSESDQFLLKLVTTSKAETKLFLLDTSLWSTRDFFGNMFNSRELKQLLAKIHVSIVSMPKPKFPQRHRGYRDKGSWKKPHEVHSFYSKDWSQLEDQNEIERQRRVLKETLQFVQCDSNSY